MTGLSQELTCRELVELVTEYLADTLPAHERTRFEAHLAECEHCRTYLQQMQQVLAAAGRLAEDDVPPAARDALLQAYRAWKAERGSG